MAAPEVVPDADHGGVHSSPRLQQTPCSSPALPPSECALGPTSSPDRALQADAAHFSGFALTVQLF